MNDLERRLHHAARELRGIEIEPPALAAIPARGRPSGLVARLPVLVMPALFVLGGLAVVLGGIGRTTDDTAATPVARPVAVAGSGDAAGTADDPAPATALTVHQELALIAALAPPEPSPRLDATGGAGDPARTLSRSYR